MSHLKSSFEKACERKLPSTYWNQLKKQQEVENDLYVGGFDFVEGKQKKEEYGDSFVENNQTRAMNKPIHEDPKYIREHEMKQESMANESVKIPECHWCGNFTSYSGFARMNRTMALGLNSRGMNVKLDIEKCPVDVNEATHKALLDMGKLKINNKSPKVFGATVPLSNLHDGKKILYTMIENSDSLHSDYVGKLNMFNEIWVPTNWNKQLFEKNNVFPKVWVMPLGVDTKRYNEHASASNLNIKLKKFTFIGVFKWNPRKGWPLLIRAFLEEFSSKDDVSLLLATRTDIVHKQQTIIDDFKGLKNSIVKTDMPHVALYDKLIKERDMPGLYKSADCFVLPSYGEGFNLPIMEAAACGLPVISTNCTAMTDYLDESNSFLINPDGFEQAKINGNLSNLAKHCRFYENQIFPTFGANALESLKERMRFVFENYQEAKNIGTEFTKKVHAKYSWEKAIDNVYNRLCDLQV